MADFDMATAGFPPMTIPCEKCDGSGVYAEYNPFDYVPAKTCDDCNGTGQRDNRDAVILALCGRVNELCDPYEGPHAEIRLLHNRIGVLEEKAGINGE